MIQGGVARVLAFLRKPGVWIPLVIVAAVAIVFHPIVFEHYTMGNSFPAKGPGSYYGDYSLALKDPAAGANQDEGWLLLIRRSLAHGHLPLVNMSNGMGAPIVESLQPGVFYLMNPLLLLLSPATPRYFDAFELLHVCLFVGGLYVLLRLYAGRSASLSVAILVGLSGIVTQNVNMVHFRCHAWFPLVLYSAIRIARGDRRAWLFFLFVLAHAAQITSGALQEAFVCSLVVGVVFVVEWWSARAASVSRARRLARMALAVACSVMIASVSVLPYLLTRGSGDILTATTPDRGIAHATLTQMSNFVLPSAVGFYPNFFAGGMPSEWLPDFSTLGVFLVIAGVVAVLMARAPTAMGRGKYAAFALILLVGVTKIAGLPAFDFLHDVPFVCEVLFVKYHLWMFTICAILAAAGLDAIVAMEPERRRTSVLFALLLIVIGGGVLVYATWVAPLPAMLAEFKGTALSEVYWSYITSVAALFAGAAVLYFRPPGALMFFVPLAVAHAMLATTNGWFPRADRYPIPIEHDESRDPSLAEPDQMGLRPRLFSRYQPNQNLITDFDVVGVFDPVCNTRLCTLLRDNFHLQHPQFDLQALGGPENALSQDQLDLLRFLGVTRVYGYDAVPGLGLGWNPSVGHPLGASMPRLWLMSSESADQLDKHFAHTKRRQALRYARKAVRPNMQLLDVHETQNGYEFRVAQDFQGELVVQQAYAHAWRLDGQSGRPFCDIFPRWTVDLRAGRTYHVEYVPLGYRAGLKISICGLALALASGLFLLRRI